jgi:hypothetical protein
LRLDRFLVSTLLSLAVLQVEVASMPVVVVPVAIDAMSPVSRLAVVRVRNPHSSCLLGLTR